jgi:thiol-disulfide isomerase/thioredoxin
MEMVAQNVGVATKAKRDRRLFTSTGLIIAAAVVIVAFAITFSFSAAWGRRMALLEQQSSTDIFRTMDLETLDGSHFTHENLKNAKVTLVNVWGTGCPPCIRELPELEALNHSYAPGEIQVVGLLSDSINGEGVVLTENIDTARDLCQKAGVTYPVLICDQDTFAFLSSAIAGSPTTFFVDQDGNVIETAVGANDLEGWKECVDEVLAQVS